MESEKQADSNVSVFAPFIVPGETSAPRSCSKVLNVPERLQVGAEVAFPKVLLDTIALRTTRFALSDSLVGRPDCSSLPERSTAKC